jgi:hypothetical protein
MTLREISALISTILVIVGTSWYIHLIYTQTKLRPVLTTWIVLSGTMTLSFVTYWTSPGHNLISNACNAISVLSTTSILATVLWFTIKQKREIVFTGFQKFCLWTSFLIAIFWIAVVWVFNGTGIIPNILTQVLVLIGYLVTAEKLYHAKVNTESFCTWWCIFVAALVALYTGIVSNDKLVILYAARTTFGTGVLIGLMYRIEKKFA